MNLLHILFLLAIHIHVSFPLDVKNLIVSSYINDYSDTNFIHFCEIVKEDFGINISDTTLNKWLREENVLSPKARKKTKKLMKKKLKQKLDQTSSQKIKNQIKLAIASVDDESAHPRRPRCGLSTLFWTISMRMF